MQWLSFLKERFALSEDECGVLTQSLDQLSPADRRLYRRRIAPRLADFAGALRAALAAELRRNPSAPDEWASRIAASMVARGRPTMLETLLIDVVGRGRVARRVAAFKQGRVVRQGTRVIR